MTYKQANNIPKVQATLNKRAEEANRQVAVQLRRGIEAGIRRTTTRRTGKLQASCRVSKTGSKGDWQVLVGVRAPYWKYQDRGTRYIRAKHFVRDAIKRVRASNPGRIYRRVFITGT